jgi:hypothetical protein
VASSSVPTKTCAVCGRTITWRKKWARDWDEVRYCSEQCRRHRPTTVDTELETVILDLLEQRATGATICPSEAARAVGGDEWREQMEPARQAEITQGGAVVDPSTARGPIRIRRVR